MAHERAVGAVSLIVLQVASAPIWLEDTEKPEPKKRFLPNHLDLSSEMSLEPFIMHVSH